jgi:hypothetical protein
VIITIRIEDTKNGKVGEYQSILPIHSLISHLGTPRQRFPAPTGWASATGKSWRMGRLFGAGGAYQNAQTVVNEAPRVSCQQRGGASLARSRARRLNGTTVFLSKRPAQRMLDR